MSDDTKRRADPNAAPASVDPAHETMPPELRPFAKPVPIQPLVAPENEASFKAAIDALRLLSGGGPNADPFYVDPNNDPAFADRKAPESVKAYASTALPIAVAAVRSAARARVIIADTDHAGEVDIRPFQGVRRAARERAQNNAPVAPVAPGAPGAPVTPGDDDVTRDEITLSMREQPPETPASPWAKEAPAEDVRGSALPSSLRPREMPSSEEDVPVRIPMLGGRTRALVFALVAVVSALLVWALGRGRPSESGAHAPMPTATTAAPTAPATTSPPLNESAEPPPAVASADRPQAPPPPASAATTSSTHPRVAPKATSAAYDPYSDAAVKPPPAVTTAPSVPPSVTAVTPPPASSPVKNPVEGDRVFGN